MTATIERTPTETTVTLVGGHRFEMPAISDVEDKAVPVILFKSVADAVGAAFTTLNSISADRTLSELGIQQKVEPVKAEILGRIAAVATEIDKYGRETAAKEAQMFALPELDPAAAAVAIEDREIRDWWRSLEGSKRTAMLDSIHVDPGQHERLMIALLRAPAPLSLLDHETKYVRESWQGAKRAANPDIAAQIDLERQVVATTVRGLTHLASITQRVVKWDANKVLRTILTSQFEPARTGYGIYGFNGEQAAKLRLMIDAGR